MTETGERLSSALEATVERFAALVHAIGGRHRLSAADIDEVMQDVRLRLWRAHPSSDALAGLGASYVYRTAVTATLDLMRRRRSSGGASATSIDDVASSGTVVSTLVARDHPVEALERQELSEQVRAAVDALAPARRPVVRMYLDGYSREEIAELLGWSEAKTRNLLYRGLGDVREQLRALGHGFEDR